MVQVKIAFNNDIKRTSVSASYEEFIINLRVLFEIPEKFSAFYFDKSGVKVYITGATYHLFKTTAENTKNTIRVIIGPQLEEDYVFFPETNSAGFPESLFFNIQSNLDYGYKNFKKLYMESKMPEMLENIRNESSNFLLRIKDTFNTFCSKNSDNHEKDLREKNKEKLNLIRTYYVIQKSDTEILDSLEKNDGDLDKTITDLLKNL